MRRFQAVITADMVNSTGFAREDAALWLEELIQTLRESTTFQWVLKPEIYRGDSFQGVLKSANDAMHVAVLARAVMRSKSPNTDLTSCHWNW
jgi:hypothetical protein